MRITGITAQRLDGSDPNDWLAVIVRTDTPHLGIGLTQAVGSTTAATLALLQDVLVPALIDTDPLAYAERWHAMRQHTAKIGWEGLLARAYAAIDLACWDLLGKQANLPVSRLLGGTPRSLPIYLAARSVQELDAAGTELNLRDQPPGVLVQLQTAALEGDLHQLHAWAEGPGAGVRLGLELDQPVDLDTALAIGQFVEEEVELDWLAEPLNVRDSAGYRRLHERLDLPLALHSLATPEAALDWLNTGTIRWLRPDLFQLGGITPLMQLTRLAALHHAEVLPTGPVEVLAAVACGLPGVRAVEFSSLPKGILQDAARRTGNLCHPCSEPGLGLRLV